MKSENHGIVLHSDAIPRLSRPMQVLMALDGSEHSREALKVAAQRPWPDGTRIRVIRVATSRPSAEQESELKAAFSAAAAISGKAPPSIEGLPVEGEPGMAILREAESWPADLVIVGSRGQSMLQSALKGSVSQFLLDRSPCPVLVARQSQGPLHSNVLLAMDESESSGAAAEWLMSQEWAESANIVLLSVVEPFSHSLKAEVNIGKASSEMLQHQNRLYLRQAMLEAWASALKHHLTGSNIHCGVVEGEAREVVVRAAKAWPSGLIVVGSRARSGIQKLLLGSVSQFVSCNAPCSVEVVRGRESRLFAELHAQLESKDTLRKILAERPKRGEQPTGQVATPGFPISLI